MSKPTWGCIHPCALLIQLIEGNKVSMEDVMHTMDVYGYTTEDGKLDVQRSEKDMRLSVLRQQPASALDCVPPPPP